MKFSLLAASYKATTKYYSFSVQFVDRIVLLYQAKYASYREKIIVLSYPDVHVFYYYCLYGNMDLILSKEYGRVSHFLIEQKTSKFGRIN
jgi:hypothetical protein